MNAHLFVVATNILYTFNIAAVSLLLNGCALANIWGEFVKNAFQIVDAHWKWKRCQTYQTGNEIVVQNWWAEEFTEETTEIEVEMNILSTLLQQAICSHADYCAINVFFISISILIHIIWMYICANSGWASLTKATNI